ncbi:MAG: SMC-Scp complex subunit ScpB [Deltaproteobacteria bacterium]|nr:SMC-Scp complex subunit ScpB [Deltaproteobacteria bacterium]
MDDNKRKAIVESLIFVSENPLSLDRIKEVLGEVSKKEIQRLLAEMAEEYNQAKRGFTLVEVAEGYQFRTRPEHAEWIKKLKKGKPAHLSQPALETLAIIAYKQPLVRGEIEKIRGVDSGGVLRTLLDKKLIKILGKKDVPGKPLVYGTSRQFLEMFGLKDLSSLPTLKDIEGLGPPAAESLLPFGEQAEGEMGTNSDPRLAIQLGEDGEIDEPPAEAAKDSF